MDSAPARRNAWLIPPNPWDPCVHTCTSVYLALSTVDSSFENGYLPYLPAYQPTSLLT